MNHLHKVVPAFVAVFGLVLPGYATVLLDDTWADGTRTNQNLPKASAWYVSTGASVDAEANSMTWSPRSDGSMAITYFTTNATNPVKLDVGDALTVNIRFTFNGMASSNKSQGFRFGLVDFADSNLSPKRVSADGFDSGTQGDGVQGYGLFQNVGDAFQGSSPMSTRKRDASGSGSLLGSSKDWVSLSSTPKNVSLFPGFANGVQYNLQFVLQRTSTNSLLIGATWLNTATGATMSTWVTDDKATNFSFDGIGMRSQGADATAKTITISKIMVEVESASKP
ncbi:MAG: hypothetical protein ABSC38_01495 [Verrucomicrobiia bacterium]